MNSTLQTIAAAIAGCVIGASITTEGVTVNNASGLTRVMIGTDDGGSGFMVILNNEGEELFAVRDEGRTEKTKPAAPKTADRVVQLVSFETMPDDEALVRQVTTLGDELARLEAELSGSHIRSRAQKKSQVRRKREEYRRLASELEDERQIIHAWDGTHRVTLTTTMDLSRHLHRIPAYGFLTWKGRRTGIDDGHEHYEVIRIAPADRPSEFEDYSPHAGR